VLISSLLAIFLVSIVEVTPAQATWSGGVSWETPQTSPTIVPRHSFTVAKRMFVTGTDGKLYEDSKLLSTGAWTGFYYIPTPGTFAFASAPVAVSPSAGELDVFGTGVDNHVWEVSYTGTWSAPTLIGNSSNLTYWSPTAIVFGATPQEDVFVLGTDLKLYEDSKLLSTGTWSGFYQIPSAGSFANAPWPASASSAEVDLFGRSLDNHVYEVTYTGVWSGPSLVGSSSN
jgi:hypothetical protein